jgi:ADP-ribosyl-[dinitrogen reductase] hydrolase
MMGLAVGDALGLEVEGDSPGDIRARFPQGVRDIPKHERERPWDDDLAQAVVLAEALLEGESLDVDDLGRRFLRWARENGRGMGYLTGTVLKLLAIGVPAGDAARLAWEASGHTSAGNGAVMRCAPVALRWFHARDRLIAETLTSAAVTHADPRCGWSAVAVNLAIRRFLLDSEVDTDALAADLEGAPNEVVDAVRSVDGSDLDGLELFGEAMGYTVKAMQVGVWAALTERSLEEALVAVVAAGGDTDTNASVAGAVLGSRFGQGSIPRRWLDRIRDADRLVQLADRLEAATHVDPSMLG